MENARVASIDDVFQAKIGWLVGQIYSRVGTPDLFDKKAMLNKVKEYSEGLAIWVEDGDIKSLCSKAQEFKALHPEGVIDSLTLRALIEKIPKRKASVIEAVLDIATELDLVKNPSLERRVSEKRLIVVRSSLHCFRGNSPQPMINYNLRDPCPPRLLAQFPCCAAVES